MTEQSRQAPRWRRRVVLGLAAVVLLAVALVAVIHTAPVRRAVLRQAVTTLQDRLALVMRAGSLSYNLFSLRITLRDVDLAATHTPAIPFAHVDALTVALPWSALVGPFAIDLVDIENARLYVVRRPDGTTNLPSPATQTTGEPAALPLKRLRVNALAVEINDRLSGVSAQLPRVAIDVGQRSGVLHGVTPGAVARGGVVTRVNEVDGDVAFDGRAIRFNRLRLRIDEGVLNARGTLALLVDTPRLDLAIDGSADLGRARRWLTGPPRAAGVVRFQGTVAGLLGTPRFEGRLTSDEIAVEGLRATAIVAGVEADAERLRLSRLDLSFEGGAVTATGAFALPPSALALTANWSGIDTGALVRRLAPDVTPRPSGRSTGSATVQGTTSLDTLMVDLRNRIDPGSTAPGQLAVGGAARLRLADGRWRLDAQPSVAGAPLQAELSGRLDWARLARSTLNGVVRVGETSVPALVNALVRARVLARPDVDLRSGATRVEARLSGTLAAPGVQLEATTRDVAVAGVSGLDVSLSARGTARQLEVNAEARQDPGNAVRVSGTVFPQARRLEARFTGRLEDPARLASGAPLSGVVDAEGTVSGAFDALRGSGRVTVANARYDRFALGPVESSVDFDAATATIAARLVELSTELHATVDVSAPRHATLDVRVDNADLYHLLAASQGGARSTEPIEGAIGLAAHAEGPIDNWREGTAAVDVTTFQAKARELTIQLVRPARLTFDRGVARVVNADATIGDTHVSVAGALPVEQAQAGTIAAADALRATLTGDVRQILAAVAGTGLVELPPIAGQGPVALLARATGSIERPLVAADLELGPGTVAYGELPPVTGVQVRAHMEDGWVDLLTLTGRWQQSTVDARGRAPLRLLDASLPAAIAAGLPHTEGPASLSARVTSITPRVLEPFLDAETLAELQGTVDASLQLQSDALALDRVNGEVRLDRLDLQIAGLPVTQREVTRVVASGGFAKIAAWDWEGQGASLGVRGQVRLADRQAALLANGRVDLRMLGAFVRDLGISTVGEIEPHLSITGALDAPRIDGDFVLTSGELRMASPRVAVADLDGRAVLSGSGVHLTRLAGTINGGTLTGEGNVEYGAGTPLLAALTTNIRGAALDFPEGFRSEVDADLELRVTQPGAQEPIGGALTGTVTVLRSGYREPLALATGLLATLRSRGIAAAASPAGTFSSRLSLDVRLVTDEDAIVDNNVGRMAMGADLRIIGTAAAPALSGRAELRPGGQLFLGRNIYTIDSGTIDFANPTTIEPDLNILARTRVAGEDIELPIKGTPANLDITPRSTTSDLDQADVWSLLLTGRRYSDIAGAEAQIVGEQVLGYLSGDVLGFASRAVGLDTIRLGGVDQSTLRHDPSAVATATDPTSRLTFGKSIGSNIDLTFSQSLRDSGDQTWIVDYLPTRRLSFRLVSDDDDLRSYEFSHDVSFGGRPRPTSELAARSASRRESRISQVSFTGTPVLPEPKLRSVLALGPGDRFDYAEWQRDRDRLEALYHREGYLEARIGAKRTPDAEPAGNSEAATVRLEYALTAGPKTTIRMTGYTASRETLAALEDAWAHSVFDGFLEDEVKNIVRRALAVAGHLRPEVAAAMTIDAAGGGKTLRIDVTPGQQTRERLVRIDADDPAVAASLDQWMRERALDRVAWDDPTRLERELTGHLREQGYLQAKVTGGALTFEGDAATRPIAVTAGRVFTVGTVRFPGADTLEEVTVRDATALAPGSIYDVAAVDAARARLATRYRREGFAGVRVTTAERVDAEGAHVDVTFAVVEGPRQLLREVTVEGNDHIDSDVIVRTLGLPIGEPLGAEAWLQARRRLFDSGLFRRVDVSAEALSEPVDGSTRPIRVRVTVEEWPVLQLQYGVKVSEERPEGEIEGRSLAPGLKADVVRRTLFGRAVSVHGTAEYQHRAQDIRGFLTAPTMFSWPVRSSLTLERSHEQPANVSLVTNRDMFSGEERLSVRKSLQLAVSYRYERNHTFDTKPSNDPFVPVFDITINIARLTGAGIFDTRDDPTNATRGSLLSGDVEYAPAQLGSDIRLVKFVEQAYHFRPWRKVVFATSGRFGIARALAGQELIFSERFLAGGDRTVRGVAQNSLGPRDFFGDPLGGEAVLVLNGEVRFPIYRWIGGVGFIDAGNVFATPSDISLQSLPVSPGVGLRLTTPLGILRMDYGKLWQGGGQWNFGIGQIF